MKINYAVPLAGFGLNFALGNIYAWSVIGKQLTEPAANGGFGWSKTEATLPYTLAIVCLALAMVPAGRLQDKFGSRLVATIGALVTGFGLWVASGSSPGRAYPALLGFGLLAGIGVALGYAAATPAAVKWFPSNRRGVVTGVVVAGFGLAPVYIAPVAHFLLSSVGIVASFRILGVIVAVAGVFCAQWLDEPPEGVASPGPGSSPAAGDAGPSGREVLRDPNFYTLWLQFAGGSIAGLMIIGHFAKIVALQSGDRIQLGFVLVALLAIFNAAGRVIAGSVSDWIGRDLTIMAVCATQAANLLLFSRYATIPWFVGGAAITGCCYGACASLFASAAADCWGTKNFGLNYGMLFTSWGVGGVIGPLLAGRIADATGSYALAYKIASGIVGFAAVLAVMRRAGWPSMPAAAGHVEQ